MIKDPYQLASVFLGLVLLSVWLDSKYAWARKISPVVMILFLFFCAVGAMINVEMAIVCSPVLFAYVMIMVVVHMISIYRIGRLLCLDIRILTIASAAAKSGPPTVVALANMHG